MDDDDKYEMVDVYYDSILHTTDNAYLLDIDGEDVWIAKSRSEIFEEDKIIEVERWLAEEKGLI